MCLCVCLHLSQIKQLKKENKKNHFDIFLRIVIVVVVLNHSWILLFFCWKDRHMCDVLKTRKCHNLMYFSTMKLFINCLGCWYFDCCHMACFFVAFVAILWDVLRQNIFLSWHFQADLLQGCEVLDYESFCWIIMIKSII